MIAFEKFSSQKHYKTLTQWWNGHKFPVVPLDSLPELGIVCLAQDKPICSGFLYKTDSNIAWMEWLLCDPSAPREYRGECINALIDKLEALAKDFGYTNIYTNLIHPSLCNRLESKGFIITDKQSINLVKVIK